MASENATGVATGGAANSASAEAMQFVQALATEVSGAPINLPSYPEAALRVQRALGDPHSDAAKIAKVIGTEPVLAARVIGMANSAALSITGKSVSDLRSAVGRVGLDALRSVTFTFAVGQLRNAANFKSIEKPMTALWQESLRLGAAAHVLARRFELVPPDTAMLAGLVSGVGKLYLLTRAAKFPALFGDPASYADVVREWHPQVARSILENWAMADEVVVAVASYEDAHVELRESVELSDLLAVGDLLTTLQDAPDMLQAKLAEDRAALRIGVMAHNVAELVTEIQAQLDTLRSSMGA
jgi:HD-like signal output (HDOD) protein